MKKQQASAAAYVTGFILSIVLTLGAYIPVYLHVHHGHKTIPHAVILPVVMSLAVVQLLVQLVFFLHMGKEGKPRWNLMALLFMLLVIVIVVFGSLWIMNNLDYHMMTPTEINTYMHDHEGL